MENDNIILSFKGVVTADLLNSVLNIIESKLKLIGESQRIKRKVYNVLVECLQNLYHHTDAHIEGKQGEETQGNSSLVLVLKENDKFLIKTGNYIKNNKVIDLESKLNEINSLDKEGLRGLYIDHLSESVISSKGTAGLGMIDIARKSGNKLDYEFLKVNDDSSFFCLNVKID